jgi:hypothetical protein
MNARLLKNIGVLHIIYAVIAIFYLIGGGAMFMIFKGIHTGSFNFLSIIWLVISLGWIVSEMWLGIASCKDFEKADKYASLVKLAWILVGTSVVEIVLSIVLAKFNATHVFLTLVLSTGCGYLDIYIIQHLVGKKFLKVK